MKTFTEIEYILIDLRIIQKMVDHAIEKKMSKAYIFMINKAAVKTRQLMNYPGEWVNAVRIIIQLRNQK